MNDRGDTYRSIWRYLMQIEFRQGYVDAAGIRTRYIQAGNPDAPPVVMIHGTGGHWEAFCANIGPLSQHFNVFALDLLGCGFSDKPDRPYEIAGYVDQVVGFMDAVGLQSASFVGVSLGTWVTVRLALAHPGRVRRMILVAPPGLLPLPASVTQAIDVRRNSAADPSWDKISQILGQLYYDQSSVIDDMVAVRQQVYKQPGLDKIMPRMLTLFDPEIRKRNNLTEDEWRTIKTPALIIEHVDAPDMYLDTARAIQKLMPNTANVEMKRTSHWPQFEDPETFNKVALDYLSQG